MRERTTRSKNGATKIGILVFSLATAYATSVGSAAWAESPQFGLTPAQFQDQFNKAAKKNSLDVYLFAGVGSSNSYQYEIGRGIRIIATVDSSSGCIRSLSFTYKGVMVHDFRKCLPIISCLVDAVDPSLHGDSQAELLTQLGLTDHLGKSDIPTTQAERNGIKYGVSISSGGQNISFSAIAQLHMVSQSEEEKPAPVYSGRPIDGQPNMIPNKANSITVNLANVIPDQTNSAIVNAPNVIPDQSNASTINSLSVTPDQANLAALNPTGQPVSSSSRRSSVRPMQLSSTIASRIGGVPFVPGIAGMGLARQLTGSGRTGNNEIGSSSPTVGFGRYFLGMTNQQFKKVPLPSPESAQSMAAQIQVAPRTAEDLATGSVRANIVPDSLPPFTYKQHGDPTFLFLKSAGERDYSLIYIVGTVRLEDVEPYSHELTAVYGAPRISQPLDQNGHVFYQWGVADCMIKLSSPSVAQSAILEYQNKSQYANYQGILSVYRKRNGRN